MKILICGVGAIGSNLVRSLVPDLKGEHEITVLDKDVVEERNVTPGTQWYMPDQIGLPKVEAIQYNAYQAFEREIGTYLTALITQGDLWGRIEGGEFDLVVDCFDNQTGRELLQEAWRQRNLYKTNFSLVHIGFSDQFTFEIEWAEDYQVPTDITTGMDICEMPGAAGFVGSVASLGALVVELHIWDNEKMRILGGKYHRSIVT